MACDIQFLQAARDAAERERRAKELREKTSALGRAIETGKVKVVVGPQGAVAFQGWAERGPISDVCAYRRIMTHGSAMAKAKIAEAEARAGVTIKRNVVAAGVHSHDGGKTWHDGH